MQTSQDRLEYLLKQYAADKCSTSELLELMDVISETPAPEGLQTGMLNVWNGADELSPVWLDKNSLYDKLISAGGIVNNSLPAPKPVHHIHFLKTAWFKYAAAIVILFGIGSYLYIIQKLDPALTSDQLVSIKNDIAPGSDKAILILADGSTIALDSAANGRLAQQAGVNVVKKSDGQLEYQVLNARSSAGTVTYNTMRTPKGGQYQLRLPDGSHVWINSASSITYPTVFPKNKREVTISGEVYFEVAKNVSDPFIVKTHGDIITVLGTSFNVNSYADEPVIKTSLVEGSVKVNDKILMPGQAFINGKVLQTDVQEDIAWKNGVFNFNGADLPSVLRQLARWYDIEVEYKGKGGDEKLIGKLSKNLPLSEVLKILEYFKIDFRMEGKKLIIQ